jgi:general secretion pathway protein D
MSTLQYSIMSVIMFCVLSGFCPGYVQGVELPRPLTEIPPEKPKDGERFITIDFDNVDIHLFVKYISELTGKNFVVDKAVQDNITIISPTKISVEEAYKVFESVLEVHGFTTVEAGSIIKIMPSARARSQNVQMLNSGFSDNPADRMVTQLVPLKHSSPDEMQKVLTPLVAQTSVLIAHNRSGILIITETLSNIQKLLGIIKALDVESREDDIAVIPLTNASAASLAKIFTTIYQNSGGAKKTAEGVVGDTIKVVPYERVNALIILANASEMGRVRSLIALLDTEVQRSEGNIHVYYLQNGTAVEMAKVLGALPEKQPQQDEANAGKAAAISKNVQIMADEETNSLIITATKDEYVVLERVIQKLDIPRRMVYLEALIMEVDADKTLEVGVEWAAAGAFADATGILLTGFSGADGFNLLKGISSDQPVLQPGFSAGVLKQGIKIGGVTFPNIAAILRAVKTNADVNVIATPQILTTDNKKAEISVGENVPFITSKNTNASNLDYTQYEYKDVATKLSITPHINQANTLRLEIVTEVVRLKDAGDTPTTFKRTATTTVILNDNDTVVIGGIIGQDATENEWKIPLLGDIPVLGWLFKTHSTTNRKTNMFIFITPRIVRNPADVISVTLKKEVEMGERLPGVQDKFGAAGNLDHTMKLLTMGYESLQAGDLNKAKMLFIKVLETDPANPFALMNMGVIHEKEGRNDLALKVYQDIVAGGSEELADKSSNPDKIGMSLRDLAKENVERLKKNADNK